MNNPTNNIVFSMMIIMNGVFILMENGIYFLHGKQIVKINQLIRNHVLNKLLQSDHYSNSNGI
jgi:hypothetical protein